MKNNGGANQKVNGRVLRDRVFWENAEWGAKPACVILCKQGQSLLGHEDTPLISIQQLNVAASASVVSENFPYSLLPF